MSGKTRIVRNLDPMERWQCENVDSIEGDSCRARYSVPACIHESGTSIRSVDRRKRRQVYACISYVLFVEFMPAVQNSILEAGGVPVVVWFHHACFVGSNTDTTLKSINVLRSPSSPRPFCPSIARTMPPGPNDGT